MSKWAGDTEVATRRIYRALIVDAYTDVSWDEYLRATKHSTNTT